MPGETAESADDQLELLEDAPQSSTVAAETPTAPVDAPEPEFVPSRIEAAPPASRPAPLVAATPVAAPAERKIRPVGRAANDPRISPRPVASVEIITETLHIDPSSFPPVPLPQPTRPRPPRAANDPRIGRADTLVLAADESGEPAQEVAQA
jgi:ribonuclease E